MIGKVTMACGLGFLIMNIFLEYSKKKNKSYAVRVENKFMENAR